MKHIIQIIMSLLFLGALIPGSALAAGFDLVNITTLPKTPGENQDVTINLEAYAVNLNSADIVWYVDKVPRKEGIAEKSLTVHTGNFGEKTTVDIIIMTADGVKINKQIVIAPAEIDLLWEAQTYTPPFYKGKALPSYKSLIRVSAIPRYNSLTSNPGEFYYKWTYNRTQAVGEALGKNSVVIPGGWPDSQVPIAVETNLPGVDWKGYQNTGIPTSDAKVVFYEQAPLLGIQFGHALPSSISTTGNVFTIRAVPYFFSTDNYLNSELLYTWKSGNSNIAPGIDPMNLTVTKAGKDYESYNISLRVQNPKRILQEGRAGATISLPAENN